MKEQMRLSKEQIEALTEDRRVHTEEFDSRRKRDQDKIQMLTEKLVFIISVRYLIVCSAFDAVGWESIGKGI